MKNRSLCLLFASVSICFNASAASQSATIYITARNSGQKLANAGPVELGPMGQRIETDQAIFVDPSKRFQTVLGIGGALTDASAETFYKLPKARQDEVLKAYFDPQAGIGYSLGRTHIHSCDFSSESYTYVQEGDRELKTFDVAHDRKFRIPFIKAAMATAGKEFTLYISPWSPPGWMKSNNNMLHGGKLKAEYADTWANYCAQFIRAYEKESIPIWGMTVQNEPMADQTWESCLYSAEEERDFVKDNLGPALKKAGLGDKQIVIWDHNRAIMYERAKVVLDDPAAAKYVWGVGFHWYVGDCFDNVQLLHEAYPNANLLFTEGCHGPFDPARINDWHWGELYAKSMIHDFNNGAVGWTDWNVLLDEKGGPNHVRNYCFAPIHADTATGAVTYMSSFYYLGHFSKFIRPGARRIISSSTLDSLTSTAFLNKDGSIVVVILNLSEQPHPFSLCVDGKAAKTSSPAHSIMTVVL